ncbi:MAG: hypothetical protein OXN17_23240 [Candidatus Poribacteria bacterium]|nr:hypothetical protein [Candidatus Poribacteria bacterium]
MNRDDGRLGDLMIVDSTGVAPTESFTCVPAFSQPMIWLDRDVEECYSEFLVEFTPQAD